MSEDVDTPVVENRWSVLGVMCAALAIVEHPVEALVSQIVVADAVMALADLARAVVAGGRQEGRLRVVGITGSNGKTTTKNLLARILHKLGQKPRPVPQRPAIFIRTLIDARAEEVLDDTEAMRPIETKNVEPRPP